MKKVYIASPYTIGDTAVNVNKSIKAANQLVKKGYCPFLPLLYHFWHLVTPKKYKEWTTLDNEWLKSCDIIVRLPGESSGADKEVALAKELGISVRTLDEL